MLGPLKVCLVSLLPVSGQVPIKAIYLEVSGSDLKNELGTQIRKTLSLSFLSLKEKGFKILNSHEGDKTFESPFQSA